MMFDLVLIVKIMQPKEVQVHHNVLQGFLERSTKCQEKKNEQVYEKKNDMPVLKSQTNLSNIQCFLFCFFIK